MADDLAVAIVDLDQPPRRVGFGDAGQALFDQRAQAPLAGLVGRLGASLGQGLLVFMQEGEILVDTDHAPGLPGGVSLDD